MFTILMLTSSYPKYKGDVTAPFIEAIAQYSQRRGHQVTVLMPHHPDLQREKVENGVELAKFHYAPLKSWNVWGYAASLEGDVKIRKTVYLILPFVLISAFLKMWQLTSRKSYDLIQAHWVIPNAPIAVLIGKLRHIPVVISLHGSDVYVAERNPIIGWVASWAFRQAAGVTASSGDLLDRAQKLGASRDPKRAVVIPYGVDPTTFTTPDQPREQIRQALGFQPTDKVLLCVGRLVYKKGFEYALRALPQILVSHPTACLVIAGAGDLLAPLKQLAGELGISQCVRFEGAVAHDKMPDYLAASDLFLLPSIVDDKGNVDGLPNTLLEALAMGKAVIASNVAGVPLAVSHNENGLLIPQRDVNALANAVNDLLNDPERCERFGQAARQKIEQELNWENIAARYSVVFGIAV